MACKPTLNMCSTSMKDTGVQSKMKCWALSVTHTLTHTFSCRPCPPSSSSSSSFSFLLTAIQQKNIRVYLCQFVKKLQRHRTRGPRPPVCVLLALLLTAWRTEGAGGGGSTPVTQPAWFTYSDSHGNSRASCSTWHREAVSITGCREITWIMCLCQFSPSTSSSGKHDKQHLGKLKISVYNLSFFFVCCLCVAMLVARL